MKHDHTLQTDTLRTPPPRADGAHTLARGLGYFSVAVGLVGILWPRRVARLADMGDRVHLSRRLGGASLPTSETLIRGYGLREVVVGAGLLATSRPMPWLWARVAGDVIDVATLLLSPRRTGVFDRSPRSGTGTRTGTLLGIAAVAAVDLYCLQALHRERQARAARPHDWRFRTGFPQPAQTMRGAASDFVPPEDMRTPALLRAWETK